MNVDTPVYESDGGFGLTVNEAAIWRDVWLLLPFASISAPLSMRAKARFGLTSVKPHRCSGVLPCVVFCVNVGTSVYQSDGGFGLTYPRTKSPPRCSGVSPLSAFALIFSTLCLSERWRFRFDLQKRPRCRGVSAVGCFSCVDVYTLCR